MHGLGQQVPPHRGPDGGGEGQHLAGVVREGPDTVTDQFTDRVRHLERVEQVGLFGRGGQHLDQVERVAPGPLRQDRPHLGCVGDPRAGQELGHLGRTEPVESQRVAPIHLVEVDQGVGQGRVGLLVVPVGRHHHEPGGVQHPEEVAQEQQRGRVGPVQVVDDQHGGLGRDPPQDRPHRLQRNQAFVTADPVGRVDPAPGRDDGDDTRQDGPVGSHHGGQSLVVQLGEVASEGLGEGFEGDDLLGAGPPVQEVGRPGPAHGLERQAGLAGAGVTAHQDDLPASGPGRGPGVGQASQFPGTPHEGVLGRSPDGGAVRQRSWSGRCGLGSGVQQQHVEALGLLRGRDPQLLGEDRPAGAVGPERRGAVAGGQVGLP